MDQIINHAVLSLDFWQDTVTYEGCAMPTGTIGCEVLNIPDSTIEKLDAPCNVLNQLLQGMNTGSVDMELLPQVQQAAGEIISFLQATPPFSRLNRSYFEQKLVAIFSEEYMEDAKRAQIEDIVKRKTSVAAENIVITPLDGGTQENE